MHFKYASEIISKPSRFDVFHKMFLLQQFQNASKILMTYEHTMSFGNDIDTCSKHLTDTSELTIDFPGYIPHSYILICKNLDDLCTHRNWVGIGEETFVIV